MGFGFPPMVPPPSTTTTNDSTSSSESTTAPGTGLTPGSVGTTTGALPNNNPFAALMAQMMAGQPGSQSVSSRVSRHFSLN